MNNFLKFSYRQESLIIVNQINVNNNYQHGNLTTKLTNDGVHDSVINATLETFSTFGKMTMIIRLNIPLNDQDNEYRREFFKTSVDVGKFFQGVQTNFVVKTFSDVFLKSADFEPKLPFPKVMFISQVFAFLLFTNLLILGCLWMDKPDIHR